MDMLPDVGRNPSYGLANDPEFSVDTVSFGDGFEQSSPAGINSIRDQWSLTWNLLRREEFDELYSFLVSKRGSEPFQWSIPDDDRVVTVKCKDPKYTYTDFGLYQLTATFREVFV